MKKSLLYIILLSIIVLLPTCKKDEEVQIASLTLENLELSVGYTTVDIKVDVCSNATINEVLFQYTTDSTFKECCEERMVKVEKMEHRYAVSLDSLLDGTKYYFRCKALNKVSSCISQKDTFTTKQIVAPTVGPISVTDVSYTSAVCVAEILSDGGSKISDRGVCYSKNENPTISDTKVQSGVGIGSFTSNLTNLTAGTTYYVRAYASNDKGTVYSEQLSFTTPNYGMPTVTTSAATNISYTTATCGGNVTADGGQTVTARGVCYSTTQNPTISNSKVQNGSGKGSFTCNLTGLSDGTTYYVRAYATNSKGTSYGPQVSFKTTAYGKPTVTTSSVSNRTTTTATCGGNVIADGGQTVTARGICYSTSQNPTISNSKVQSGSGKGAFTCALTNLIEGETYYVRAYATNSRGTSYGSQVSFTTISTAFSTSPTNKVHFAPGNLQYNAMLGTHQCADGTTKKGTWRFAEHQYDVVGYANQNISASYNGWIDLFGWATSGYNNTANDPGAYSYQPWCTESTSSTASGDGYGPSSNMQDKDLVRTSSYYDWGVYNIISNGFNNEGFWRTLTYTEWKYLSGQRQNADNLKGLATINNVCGCVLLPDDWSTPADLSFVPTLSDYMTNQYSSTEWAEMESLGAVFLPAAGYRLGIGIYKLNETGEYWSTSSSDDFYNRFFAAEAFCFGNGYSGAGLTWRGRDMGLSVRLVRDINP